MEDSSLRWITLQLVYDLGGSVAVGLRFCVQDILRDDLDQRLRYRCSFLVNYFFCADHSPRMDQIAVSAHYRYQAFRTFRNELRDVLITRLNSSPQVQFEDRYFLVPLYTIHVKPVDEKCFHDADRENMDRLPRFALHPCA